MAAFYILGGKITLVQWVQNGLIILLSERIFSSYPLLAAWKAEAMNDDSFTHTVFFRILTTSMFHSCSCGELLQGWCLSLLVKKELWSYRSLIKRKCSLLLSCWGIRGIIHSVSYSITSAVWARLDHTVELTCTRHTVITPHTCICAIILYYTLCRGPSQPHVIKEHPIPDFAAVGMRAHSAAGALASSGADVRWGGLRCSRCSSSAHTVWRARYKSLVIYTCLLTSNKSLI